MTLTENRSVGSMTLATATPEVAGLLTYLESALKDAETVRDAWREPWDDQDGDYWHGRASAFAQTIKHLTGEGER